jgi:hypothetical protein
MTAMAMFQQVGLAHRQLLVVSQEKVVRFGDSSSPEN